MASNGLSFSFSNNGSGNFSENGLSTEFNHDFYQRNLTTEIGNYLNDNDTSQHFFKEVVVHYNLKHPKGNKPTMVYLVCYINKKQIKISTGCKVYPKQWNKVQAITSSLLSANDNRNNILLNAKIDEMNVRFSEYMGYLCANGKEPNNKELKCYIMNRKIEEPTKPKKDICTYLRAQIINSSASGGTQGNQLNWLKKLKAFLQTKDNYQWSLKLWAEYREFLCNTMKSTNKNKDVNAETINKTLSKTIGLLRKYAVTEGYITFDELNQLKSLPPLAGKSHSKDNEIALTNEEVIKLYNYECTNEEDTIIKDSLLFLCATGQRYEDIEQERITLYKDNGRWVFKVLQDKTAKPVENYIPFKIGVDIVEKYDGKIPVCNDKHKFYERIKEIAKKAGIKGTETIVNDTIKGKHEEKVNRYDLIAGHTGRRTFVTLMRLHNKPYEEIKHYTGHDNISTMENSYDKLVGAKVIEDFKQLKANSPEKVVQLVNEEVAMTNKVETIISLPHTVVTETINEYAIDRDIDLSKFDLTEDEKTFLNRTSDSFGVGSPNLKTRKILNRLVSLGIVVKLSE